MRQQTDMLLRPVEISIYICIIPAFQLLWQKNPSQNRLWECREFFGGVGLPNSFLHVTNSRVGNAMGFVLGFAWPTWRGWRCSHGGQTSYPKIWGLKNQGPSRLHVMAAVVENDSNYHDMKTSWIYSTHNIFLQVFLKSFSGVLLSERKHVIFPFFFKRFIWELHI